MNNFRITYENHPFFEENKAEVTKRIADYKNNKDFKQMIFKRLEKVAKDKNVYIRKIIKCKVIISENGLDSFYAILVCDHNIISDCVLMVGQSINNENISYTRIFCENH